MTMLCQLLQLRTFMRRPWALLTSHTYLFEHQSKKRIIDSPQASSINGAKMFEQPWMDGGEGSEVALVFQSNEHKTYR